MMNKTIFKSLAGLLFAVLLVVSCVAEDPLKAKARKGNIEAMKVLAEQYYQKGMGAVEETGIGTGTEYFKESVDWCFMVFENGHRVIVYTDLGASELLSRMEGIPSSLLNDDKVDEVENTDLYWDRLDIRDFFISSDEPINDPVLQDYIISRVNRYLALAIDGDATAQYVVGEMYILGIGIRKDNAKAVKWFRKAAAQGFKPAQDMLKYYGDN